MAEQDNNPFEIFSESTEKISMKLEYKLDGSSLEKYTDEELALKKEDFKRNCPFCSEYYQKNKGENSKENNTDNSQGKQEQVEIIQDTTSELSERDKIIQYAEISDIAYSVFERWDDGSYNVSSVNLDPLSIDLRKIIWSNGVLHSKMPENLSEDEQKVYSSMVELKEKWISETQKSNSWEDKNIQNIIDMWVIQNPTDLAYLSPHHWWEKEKGITKLEYMSYKADTEQRKENVTIAEEALKELKQSKTEWAKKNFERAGKKYEILDTFPKNWETRWGSWLNCVLLKDADNNKYLSIAWTQFDLSNIRDTDFDDILADIQIVMNTIPEAQTKDLIGFIQTIKLEDWEKIRIVWHSLGWTLTQIWASTFWWDWWIVSESYTFNAPWAKTLQVNESSFEWEQLTYIQAFRRNREDSKVGELLTNVRTSGDWIVSMIPDKNNVPIWNYEIVLEWWSHALDDVRELLADSDVEVVKKKFENIKPRIDKDPSSKGIFE